MGKGIDSFVSGRAKDYLQRIQHTKQAYDAHQGRKVLVRYEELRADTLGTMRRIRSALELPMDENELSQAVAKHSWENIPDGEKGGRKVLSQGDARRLARGPHPEAGAGYRGGNAPSVGGVL